MPKHSEFVETQEEAALRILKGLNFKDFDQFALMNNQVVGAIYSEPEKTKGGVFITDKRRAESEYQSKTLLIIGLGTSAYRDDTGQWFQGRAPVLGDWVVIRASDGWRIDLHSVQCRMFDDALTRMIVPHPEMVW